MQRSVKRFCITDNTCNYDFWRNLHCRYIIAGQEKAPQTNKLHLQIYVEFDTARRLSTFIRAVQFAHIEIARGTQRQNIDYCKKDGLFAERGTPLPGSGGHNKARITLDDYVKLAQTMPEHQLFQLQPAMSLLHGNKLDAYISKSIKPRHVKPTVYWFYGMTGSGKTKAAYDLDPDAYFKPPSTQFWQNYRGQKTVIIDDFRPDHIPWSQLLQLLDKYPHTVNVKGGHATFNSPLIIFTAPLPPHLLYTRRLIGDEDIHQLVRRIDQIIKFERM